MKINVTTKYQNILDDINLINYYIYRTNLLFKWCSLLITFYQWVNIVIIHCEWFIYTNTPLLITITNPINRWELQRTLLQPLQIFLIRWWHLLSFPQTPQILFHRLPVAWGHRGVGLQRVAPLPLYSVKENLPLNLWKSMPVNDLGRPVFY